jgi:tartrate-resistant acid phosphatase type 5
MLGETRLRVPRTRALRRALLTVAVLAALPLVAGGQANAGPSDGPVRIGVVGDFGWNHPITLQLRDLVRNQNPDYLVTVGDNVQTKIPATGTDIYDFTTGKLFCQYIANAAPGPYCPSGGTSPTNRFFPSPGNHDYSDGGPNNTIGNYLSYFGQLPGAGNTSTRPTGSKLYYDVVLGPVHFFLIDSEGALRSSTFMAQQRAWLESAMKASTSPFQAVVLHDPPYSSGLRYGSATLFQWPYAEWGADLVLSGHHHAYERVQRNGISYVTNGLGGDYPQPWGTIVGGSVVRFGNRTTEDTVTMMVLTATATSLRMQTYAADRGLIDDHTITNGSTSPTTTSSTTTSTTSSTTTSTTSSTTTSSTTTSTTTTTAPSTTTSTTTTAPSSPTPGAFAKLSPSDRSRNLRSPVTLSWGSAANASSYEYCLDTIDNGVCDTLWISTGTSRSVTVSNLAPRSNQFWQVRARNSHGTTSANDGSWWSFSIHRQG